MAPWHIRGWRRARCACPEEPGPAFLGRRRARCSPCSSPRRRTSGPRRPSASRREWRATRPRASCALAEAVVRRQREADVVGNRGLLRVGDEGRGNRRVDPHAALAGVEQRQVFVEAVGARTRRTGVMHAGLRSGQRRLPFRGVELRLPLLVEPARAVRNWPWRSGTPCSRPSRPCRAGRRRRCSLRLVSHGTRGLADEFPGGCVRHLRAGLVHQVGPVHDHRAFAIERRGQQLAVEP